MYRGGEEAHGEKFPKSHSETETEPAPSKAGLAPKPERFLPQVWGLMRFLLHSLRPILIWKTNPWTGNASFPSLPSPASSASLAG